MYTIGVKSNSNVAKNNAVTRLEDLHDLPSVIENREFSVLFNNLFSRFLKECWNPLGAVFKVLTDPSTKQKRRICQVLQRFTHFYIYVT